MTTVDHLVHTLKEEKDVISMYRFQGGQSYPYYDVKNNSFEEKDYYLYLSSTKAHHQYFALRRIRKYLNNDLLQNTPYMITNCQLQNSKKYMAIKNLILNAEKIKSFTSVDFVCDQSFLKLLRENAVSNRRKKKSPTCIEKVDFNSYGGGYGIKEDWLLLFQDMILCKTVKTIHQKELIELLKTLRRTGKITYFDALSSYFVEKNYTINENYFTDYHKYVIKNHLENIVDKGLYLENTSLALRPKEVIKEVSSSYQKRKEKVLTYLEKQDK